MTRSSAEHRLSAERREAEDRRGGPERRSVDRRQKLVLLPAEQRSGEERRRLPDRRKRERRGQETPEEHIRNALQLLSTVAESGVLDEELRRDLESAMFRLRFAVDRLEHRR